MRSKRTFIEKNEENKDCLTLNILIFEKIFVSLHMRRIVSSVMVVGSLFQGANALAQTKQVSPFNTVGYSYQKPTMKSISDDEDAQDMDEFTDIDNTIAIPPDSIKPHLPMVSFPLKSIKVNSPFGMRRDPMNRRKYRMHNGIDLKAKYEVVYSMLPGTVTATSYSVNGGNYITVNHGVCVCSYLHLSKFMVAVGQHVNAGQAIAISGNTGKRTTGPHLHLACRLGDEKGKFFDPMLILGFVSEQIMSNNR